MMRRSGKILTILLALAMAAALGLGVVGSRVSAADSCDMEVDIPAGTYVYINNVGWFQDGATVSLPMGTTISYRATDATKNISTDWQTKKVDCSPLAPAYCEMEVDIPSGTFVYINNVNWFQDGAKVWLPEGVTISYRATDATKNISTDWLTKKVDCSPLAPAYCEMEVDIPTGTFVYINNVNWFQDGAKVWLPEGVTISYRATDATKNISTDWLTKKVDCTPLKPDYCEMEVQLPADVWVYINGSGWYQNGAKVWLPGGVTISYRATDATKNISTDWLTKKVDCTPLKPDYCEMEVKLEAGVWSKVYINGSGWYVNGAKVWLPKGVTISYYAIDAKGASTCWLTKPIDCTPLVPKCDVTIKLPPGVYVYVNGVGWFQNGQTISNIKPTKTYSYRLTDATKNISTGWKTKTFTAAECCNGWDLQPEYCEMLVDLPDSEVWVYINGSGWYQDGAKVWLPKGVTISYRATDKTKNISTGWLTKAVDCTALVPGYCNMLVDLPDSEVWVYINGSGWYQDGAHVQLPQGVTISYRATDKTKNISTGWLTKDVDCTALVPGYCNMLVDLPDSEVWVYINGSGWYQDGAHVQLPKGVTISYRATDKTKNISTGWLTKDVDCTDLVPGYCNMLVDLPDSEVWVYINGSGWYQDGAHVQLPQGVTISYRATDKTKNISTGWLTKAVDCTALAPGYCNMEVKLEAGAWSKVYINGSGWYQNGAKVQLPVGVTISYYAIDAKGVSTCWLTKVVDCTPLVPECKVRVVLPEGVWIEIQGVGWFQNGAEVSVKPVIAYQYRLTNANKAVGTAWKAKSFSASDCCKKDWDLTGEFCHMKVNLGGSDGWVEIQGVGWFKDGDLVWMPKTASFQYRATNANKAIGTGWQTKNVDCTDLVPEFCHMKVDLGGSDGWVEIQGVGWFQDGDLVWMPKTASFQYRATNANKAIGTGWQTKNVDCSDLAPEFCHMEVNLGGSDGWVEIQGVGWFQDGDLVWMPKGASFQYRATNANKAIGTGWQAHTVDCGDLAPGFCHMKVDLDDSDGWVEIQGVGWFQDNAQVWMPTGATFQFRATNANKAISTGWKAHTVDCGDLAPAFCNVGINLSGIYTKVEIQGVGWFQNGTHVWMPTGATFQFRATDANGQNSTGWIPKTVDCTDLVYPGAK